VRTWRRVEWERKNKMKRNEKWNRRRKNRNEREKEG
jgi:hypothetical protein